MWAAPFFQGLFINLSWENVGCSLFPPLQNTANIHDFSLITVFPQVTVHQFLKDKKINWTQRDIKRKINKAEVLDKISVYTTQVDDLSVFSLLQETGQQTGHPYQAWANNRALETDHFYHPWIDDTGNTQAPLYESSLYRESLFNTMEGVMVFPYQLADTTEQVSGPIIKSCSSMSLKSEGDIVSGKAQLEGYHATWLTVGEFLDTIKLFGFTMKSLTSKLKKTDRVPFEAVAKFIWEIEGLVISTKEKLKAFLSKKPWTNIYVYNDDWPVEKNYRMLAQLVRSMTRMRWGIFDGQHRALNLYCGYRGHVGMSSVVNFSFPTYRYLQPHVDQPAAVTAEMVDEVLQTLPNRRKKKFVYGESFLTNYTMRVRVGTAGKKTLKEEFAALRSFGAFGNAGYDTHIRTGVREILMGWHESLQDENFEFQTFDEKELWALKTQANASAVIEPFNALWFNEFCNYIAENRLEKCLQKVAGNTNDKAPMCWDPHIKKEIKGKLKSPKYILSGKDQECNNIPRITGVMFCVLKFVMTSKRRFKDFMKFISFASLEQPTMPQLQTHISLPRLTTPDWLRCNFGFPVMMGVNFLTARVVYEWRFATDMATLEKHSKALEEDKEALQKHGKGSQILTVDAKVGNRLAKLKDLHVKRWQQQRKNKNADFTCLLPCYDGTVMYANAQMKTMVPSNVDMKRSSAESGKYEYIFTGGVINGIFAEFAKRGPNPLIMSMEEAKEKANGRPVYENVLLDIYLR